MCKINVDLLSHILTTVILLMNCMQVGAFLPQCCLTVALHGCVKCSVTPLINPSFAVTVSHLCSLQHSLTNDSRPHCQRWATSCIGRVFPVGPFLLQWCLLPVLSSAFSFCFIDGTNEECKIWYISFKSLAITTWYWMTPIPALIHALTFSH